MRTRVGHRFLEKLQGSDNPVGLSVAVLLAWVGFGDGHLSSDERDLLKSLSLSGLSDADFTAAISHAKDGDVTELQIACEVVRRLDAQPRKLLLELAVAIALADGRLSNAECHLILFLTDLLGFTPTELTDVFRAQAGSDFPIPGDVSSIEWWEKRRTRSSGNTEDRERRQTPSSTRATAALSTLGLESGASASEIREAFLRLSKVHHPDRFHQLGSEAVAAATVTFKRIKEAYEVLGEP